MKGKLCSVYLIATLICSFFIFLNVVQAISNVRGVIGSDTTWTKSNSPYTLTAPLDVKQGVTLTIESGVTVNLGKFYLQVDGKLNALGTSTDNIVFNSYAPSYDELLGNGDMCQGVVTLLSSGSILENVIITSNQKVPTINVDRCSALINNCSVIHDDNYGSGYGIILNVAAGNNAAFPTVSNCNIIADNSARAGNMGDTGIAVTSPGASPLGYALISHNVISGWALGILASGGTNPTIEHNLIVNNKGDLKSGYGGIRVSSDGTSAIIRNNTIMKNSVGFYFDYVTSPTIIYNNIQQNDEFSVYLSLIGSPATKNIEASNNWWGTNDTQVIEKSICDFEDNFNLGKVNYIPFLTEPNLDAPVYDSSSSKQNIVLPTSSPTNTPLVPIPTLEPLSDPTVYSTPFNTKDSNSSLLQIPDSIINQSVVIVAMLAIIIICTIMLYKKIVRHN